jgi:hypothetical protein
MFRGLLLPLGVFGQNGQDIVRVDAFDIPISELVIELGQIQPVIFDRIFSPSLPFDTQ